MHCTTAVWVSCPTDRVFSNGTHYTSTWTDPPTLPSALCVPRCFESLRERMTSDAGKMGGRRDGGVETRTRLLRRGPALLDLCCQTDSNAVDVMDSAVSRRTHAGLRKRTNALDPSYCQPLHRLPLADSETVQVHSVGDGGRSTSQYRSKRRH